MTLVLNAAPVKMGVTAVVVPLGPNEPPPTEPDGFLLMEKVVDAYNVPVPAAAPELLVLAGRPELLTDTPGTEVTGMTITVLVVSTVAEAVTVVMGFVSVTVVGVAAQ